MGIMDDLEEEARSLAQKGKDLAEAKGRDLLEQGKQAVGAKAGDLENQAAKKVADFVDGQKQKLTDRLKK